MIINEYYIWLICKINNSTDIVSNYNHLLSYLLNIEFRWKIENDKNRAIDGRALRDEFANGDDEILMLLNSNLPRNCSVLEMFVALSERCEFDIMHDPYTDEDRTHFWFWSMMYNMHLDIFDDAHFNPDGVETIIWKWLDRDDVGPFPLHHPIEDFRNVEIWSQMNRWLDENYDY